MPFQFLSRFFSKPPNVAKAWRKAGGAQMHAFIMFAHPVYLALGRDHFVLPAPAPLVVAEADAQAIIASLNQHFAAQNMQFYWQQNQWFLGLEFDPKISTSPLEQALNQDVTPYLPQGEGALAWAKFSNEIQMLLFNHPTNAAREARRELPINSLWFDGLSKT